MSAVSAHLFSQAVEPHVYNTWLAMPVITFPATEHCHCPLPVPVSHPTYGERLSWSECLVVYQDSVLTYSVWSPILVLHRLDIIYLS